MLKTGTTDDICRASIKHLKAGHHRPTGVTLYAPLSRIPRCTLDFALAQLQARGQLYWSQVSPLATPFVEKVCLPTKGVFYICWLQAGKYKKRNDWLNMWVLFKL